MRAPDRTIHAILGPETGIAFRCSCGSSGEPKPPTAAWIKLSRNRPTAIDAVEPLCRRAVREQPKDEAERDQPDQALAAEVLDE